MDANKLTVKSQEALSQAQTTALRFGHQEVDAEHLRITSYNVCYTKLLRSPSRDRFTSSTHPRRCSARSSVQCQAEFRDSRLAFRGDMDEGTRKEFEEIGYVRLPGLIDGRSAKRMNELVWEALNALHGIERDNPETWVNKWAGLNRDT